MALLAVGTTITMRVPHPILKIGIEAAVIVAADVMAASSLVKGGANSTSATSSAAS